MICGVCGNDHGITPEPLTCQRVRELARALIPVALAHANREKGQRLHKVCKKIVDGETNVKDGL